MFARPQPPIQHMRGVGRAHCHAPAASGGVTSLGVGAVAASSWGGRTDQEVGLSFQRLLEVTLSVFSTVGRFQQIAVRDFLDNTMIFRRIYWGGNIIQKKINANVLPSCIRMTYDRGIHGTEGFCSVGEVENIENVQHCYIVTPTLTVVFRNWKGKAELSSLSKLMSSLRDSFLVRFT